MVKAEKVKVKKEKKEKTAKKADAEEKKKKRRSRTESYDRYLKLKSEAEKVPIPNKDARAVLEQFIAHLHKSIIHHGQTMLKDGKKMVTQDRLDLVLASFAETQGLPERLHTAMKKAAHEAVGKMGPVEKKERKKKTKASE